MQLTNTKTISYHCTFSSKSVSLQMGRAGIKKNNMEYKRKVCTFINSDTLDITVDGLNVMGHDETMYEPVSS